jgi:hypothetical protein
MESRLASAALIVVFATYLFLGAVGLTGRGMTDTADHAYNRLSRGLLSGHLYADKPVPPGLERLPDPYDPRANEVYRMGAPDLVHDFSYYKGRLYLYFGVAPALLVFIPWHMLTGMWLAHWVAVAGLCAAGLLVNLSLFLSIRAALFADSPPWMPAVAVLIMGLGSYAPILLARADMWEVPIAFSYLGTSVALRCLWEALGRPGAAGRWLALASLAMGAAFAARPTVLPNAAILLIPFLCADIRRSGRAWAGVVIPLGACGAAVALYNALRFGSPLDFGQRYQLAAEYVSRVRLFSPGFLRPNLKLYLFQAVAWRKYFPFASEPPLAALPAHHGEVEHISGALLNAPVLWAGIALAVLVGTFRRDRRFVMIAACAAWIAASSLVLMSLFFGICSRYQFEFLPALSLLAALGVMAAEGALNGTARAALRCLWIPALALSATFPVLYGIDRCIVDHNAAALLDLSRGNLRDANNEVDLVRSLAPGDPFYRIESGVILVAAGRTAEAGDVFTGVVRDFPGDALARFNLAHVLENEGHIPEAIVQYREALRLAPDSAAIRAGLDAVLARAGKGTP